MSELADDEPSLLNVDLVLESDRPFDQLSEALSASLFAMDEGSSVSPAPPYRARFETNLVHWSTRVRRRPPGRPALRCGPHETSIDEHSLATIVRLGGRLLVTVYSPVAPE